jgi:hypothetical protein
MVVYYIRKIDCGGRKVLIEELFSSGVMQMGSSRVDPGRQVGVFNPAAVAGLPELRAARMKEFSWIAGEWNRENVVPATKSNPAYVDVGNGKFSICEKGDWICMVAAEGREIQQITFDPFSRQWMYVLMNGAYGILRSREGWKGNKIAFTGTMTMLGIECEWRMQWTKESEDRFSFVNEERCADGSWDYIDEWHFKRKG